MSVVCCFLTDVFLFFQFLEQKKKREEEVMKKVAVKSHRERVAEFNERLSTLTEHFDLPRIGPG